MVRLDTRKHVTADEVAEMLELVDVVETFTGHPALPEQSRLMLQQGDSDCLAIVVAHDDTGIVAFAQISPNSGSWTLDLVVVPDPVRSRPVSIDTLVNDALDALVDDGHTPADVTWWRSGHHPHDGHHHGHHETHHDVHHQFEHRPDGMATFDDLHGRLGFRFDRELLQLRRSLPTGTPVTIKTRSFVPGQDDRAFLDVNNRAFADHPEQGGWTQTALELRQRETWFDPRGFRLHERDGRLAGFCWTKVHPPSPAERHHAAARGLGEVYVIAVDPDFAGQGLGSQLTLAGLEYLADLGITEAMLYVDADNTGAVSVYDRIGFRTHSSSRAFVRHIGATPPHPARRAAASGASSEDHHR